MLGDDLVQIVMAHDSNTRVRGPLLLLATAYLFFIAYVLVTSPNLPARLATHFDIAGNPNGWMSRTGHVAFLLGMGVTLPLLVPAICFLAARFGNGSGLNLPNREFWLAPERKDATAGFIVRHSLWFSTGFTLFFASIHYAVVAANTQSPPHLPPSLILGFAGGFLVFVIGWALRLVFHFLHLPTPNPLPAR